MNPHLYKKRKGGPPTKKNNKKLKLALLAWMALNNVPVHIVRSTAGRTGLPTLKTGSRAKL
jgi:hypothetical protein